ncbi:MAG: hypothetical protein ACOYXO_05685 [Chloroflexota bacterium]
MNILSFLEYALNAYSAKEIVFYGTSARRKARRLTVYPFYGADWAGEDGWTPDEVKKVLASKKIPKNRKTVSFRISDEIHEHIKQIAGETYSTGEICAVLLKHALVRYQQGRLHPPEKRILLW